MAKFAEQEKFYQLPSGHLAKIARIESKGNATAGSPGRAYGLFQWFARDFYDWSGKLYGVSKDPSLRANPFVSAEVTAFRQAKARDIMRPYVARVAGSDLGVGMYFVHFMGEGGAPKLFQLLASAPQASASQYFPKEAASNASIFNGRTIVGVYNLIAQKMQQTGITGISNYTTTFDGDPRASRLLDDAGSTGLQRTYSGPVPPPNPSQTYQSDGTPYPGVTVPSIPTSAASSSSASASSQTKLLNSVSVSPSTLGFPVGIGTGQVLAQDYYCVTSVEPVVVVPVTAGTPFPPNCYNTPPSSAVANPAQPRNPNGNAGTNAPTARASNQSGITSIRQGSSPTTGSVTIPPTGFVLAQPRVVARGTPVLVSWSSVGMSSQQSCQMARDMSVFSDGNEGSQVLQTSSWSLGAHTFLLSCTTSSGQLFSQSATVTVQ